MKVNESIKYKIQMKNMSEEKKDLVTTIKTNVKLQVQNLKKSPIITQLIAENKVKIVGGFYDLNTAKVSLIS